MSRLRTLALAALFVAGCGALSVLASPSPTTPVKPTAGPIVLRTASSPVPASPCPAVAIVATLIEHEGTGLGLLDETGRVKTPVIWPVGYRANPSIGGSNLYEASGQLVARTGDRVLLHAVQLEAGGPLLVCGIVERMPFDDGSGA